MYTIWRLAAERWVEVCNVKNEEYAFMIANILSLDGRKPHAVTDNKKKLN